MVPGNLRERLEANRALDTIADPFARTADAVLTRSAVKDGLHGDDGQLQARRQPLH